MWTHQREAVEWAVGRRSPILHMGMGTGKSRACLETLKAEGRRLVLICCPKAVIPAWKKQAGLWMPGTRVLLLTKGTTKDKEKALAAARADTSPLIVVVNYESAWRMDALEKTPWDALVYDECHRLKSPSGATSRWAAKMGRKFPETKRIGLSGTLLAHSPMDAFGVYRAMESPKCETFGTSFTAFRARYAISHATTPGWIIGYRNTQEFGTKIALTTFHRRSEDVLDLPELMHERVDVELNSKEASAYREIDSDFCATLDKGDVTPANVLVQLLRLLEICGGSVHVDGSPAAVTVSERPSKAAALAELLEDLPPQEPVVVFCKYKADITNILVECKKLGREASELSGSRNELADWQAGKTSVLVANTASGGIGIDLTRASYGVFYSVGHSLAEYLQAVARLHRPGQTKTTHFYNLVATVGGRQTVDGLVYEALSERQEVIDAIIAGRHARRDAGADQRHRQTA